MKRMVAIIGLVTTVEVGNLSILAEPSSPALLTRGHMDLQLRFNPELAETNRLDLVLGVEGLPPLESGGAYLVCGAGSRVTIPNNPAYAFLGAPGESVWILPQTQTRDLPYLGLSAEVLPTEWAGHETGVELVSAEGPGRFYFWSVSGAGQPPSIQLGSTTPGVAPQANRVPLSVGSHVHGNWGFTKPGLYRLTLRAVAKPGSEVPILLGREVTFGVQVPPLSPWETWVAQNWPPNVREAQTKPEADPDGDGLPNIAEYVLGSDPRTSSPQALPQVALEGTGGSMSATLVFRRRKAEAYRTSVWARDEAGSGAWEELQTQKTQRNDSDFEEVAYVDSQTPSSKARRFYQLRIAPSP